MQAELIAIGSELTGGHTINANAASLARQLGALGISCQRHLAIGDERELIIEAVRDALTRADLVITTGGLGPTMDDITMEAVAEAVQRPLVAVPEVAQRIRAFYRARRRALHPEALRQANVPSGGVALPNSVGTAPGLWLELEGRALVALPGVPAEMRAIMEEHVLPRLSRATREPILSRTIRTIGMVELDIQAALKKMAIPPEVTVGLYPQLRAVDLRFTLSGQARASATRMLDRLERAARRRLDEAVYGVDDQTLEGVIGQALVRRHLTLAIAESCTGGLVADRITNVPGSSRYLLVGVVAYHNRMKETLLEVPSRLLIKHGAVSAPVAVAMARGARVCAKSDLGLAITGIAGPTGGTAKKPVGLVYVAIADATRAESREFRFHGDRRSIKYQTSQMALDWLRRWIIF